MSAQPMKNDVHQVELQYSDSWLAALMDFARESGISWRTHRLVATDAAGELVGSGRQPHLDASDFPVNFQFTPKVPEVAIHIDWSADGIPSRDLATDEQEQHEAGQLLIDWSLDGLPSTMQRKASFLGPKGALRRRHEHRAPIKPSSPKWALPKQQEALSVAELVQRAPVHRAPCPRAPVAAPKAQRIQQPGGHKATSRGNFARR